MNQPKPQDERSSDQLVRHTGGCHCGRVQLAVWAPKDVKVDECNCSICSMSGYLHLIVEADQFELLEGQEALTTYQFGTNTARHDFCKVCGVKSFYVPRSHPEGFSVNFRCLDQSTFGSVQIKSFDGQKWEQNIDELRQRT